ncbi:DUF6266 family protein [Pedobacter sp. B4-66]|uniref:DUF6266 family protein n=1 Tax=Pedobacter sp. B4-66 TaxID=2817280 RepID=UPI001BDAC87B|nr:DUF6266 family protein [Pedobacter sp. B4-66]
MAKIKKGILGPVSGQIGPVIGSSWKGIPYVRGESQKEPKERTQGQLATQQKMKFINNTLVPFHPYINIGFANNAFQKTEISAAFSLNYNTAFLGTYPNLSVDYSKLVLSVGKLPMIENITIELIDPENVKLTWSQNNVRPASFDDQLMLILYCEELHKTDGLVGGFKRTDTQCTFKFNPKFAGKTLHAFVSMTSIDRKKIANSVYFGML